MKQHEVLSRDDWIAARKALSLEPNGYYPNLYMGFFLQFAGEGSQSVEYTERAMRLNRVDTVRSLAFLGRAHFINGTYEKAIEAGQLRFSS